MIVSGFLFAIGLVLGLFFLRFLGQFIHRANWNKVTYFSIMAGYNLLVLGVIVGLLCLVSWFFHSVL